MEKGEERPIVHKQYYKNGRDPIPSECMRDFLNRLKKTKCILIVCVTALVSCQQSQAVLRVGTNVWPGYEPLYMARELGYYTPDRLHLVEYTSASQVIQAFHNDLIDAAALTLDEVFLLLEHGEDVELVLVMDFSNGADVILGDAGINRMEDLVGRRVGVEANALGSYVLSRALEIHQIGKDQITIVSLNIAEHEAAIRVKKVDAVVTFEPVRSKLLALGAKLLFDSSEIPNEVVDVLVVKRDYAKKYPKQIEYLKEGWFRALDMFDQKPLAAAAILGKRTQVSAQDTLAVYSLLTLPNREQNRSLLAINNPDGLSNSARRLADLMHERGLLSTRVDPTALFAAEKK
jgi:NitT/TauT family transport system substrate-binding protein